MADKCPLSEQEQGWLDGGIAEFNTGRYWHAHEDWEEIGSHSRRERLTSDTS